MKLANLGGTTGMLWITLMMGDLLEIFLGGMSVRIHHVGNACGYYSASYKSLSHS